MSTNITLSTVCPSDAGQKTLAELRQGLHTSVSQISCFLRCPASYNHRYVHGTPPSHKSVALSFGSAIHHALALHYEHMQTHGEKLPLADLHDTFAGRIEVELADKSVPILFDDGQDGGTVKDQGVAMLSSFHEHGFVPDKVVGVEVPFAVDLADPETGEVLDIPLIGGIDLVAEKDGRVVLVEHKTAARRFDATRLRYDLQPTTYTFAARSLRIVNPAIAFHVLLKSKGYAVEYTPITRSKADEVEMLQTFAAVLKGVEAGVFFRNRGWACADCQFRRACGG